MLPEVIKALEMRKESLKNEQKADGVRRNIVGPILGDVSSLLLQILQKSANSSSNPEDAFSMLRTDIVDLHHELMANVEVMKNADHIWNGRQQELEHILNDLKTISQAVNPKTENLSPEQPQEEQLPEENKVSVRARPRSIGEKPVSLRQSRNSTQE